MCVAWSASLARGSDYECVLDFAFPLQLPSYHSLTLLLPAILTRKQNTKKEGSIVHVHEQDFKCTADCVYNGNYMVSLHSGSTGFAFVSLCPCLIMEGFSSLNNTASSNHGQIRTQICLLKQMSH